MPKMPLHPHNSVPFALQAGGAAPHPPPSKKLTADNRKKLLLQLQRGLDFQRAGQFLDAERCYQLVLQRAPAMPEANALMGTIAIEAKDFAVAVEYLEKAIDASPKVAQTRHNLASALLNLNDYHAAITHLRKALDLKPGQVESLVLMAIAYNQLSRSAEALRFAEKALRLDPQHQNARLAFSEALINLGRMDEAAKFLNETIAAHIAVPRAFQSLSNTQKFAAHSPELASVLSEIENSSYNAAQRSHLHFAAAKMSNDAKLYDQAMAHYLEAKSVSAAAFDIGAYEKRIDNLIALFNPMFLGVRQNIGNPSPKPVFIVGMPRSGTTLTEQIISSHHQVAGAGELSELAAIARSLGDHPKMAEKFAMRLSALNSTEAQHYGQRYLKFIARTSHDAARITDKMPHNFEYIGLIALLFPHATIIHCRRDAIDNCLSCYMNSFSEAHSYNTDLAKLGRYYRAYDRLMKHWHKVLPGRIFENHYETLVNDQEGQSRKMIAHCNLLWDEACLNYTANERSVTTISRWQVRQPIYKTSMTRWKPYEKHLGPLIAALGDLAVTE